MRCLRSDGANNTALGALALLSNINGIDNTASGVGTLQLDTVGSGNTAFGFDALSNNSGGNNNIGIGVNAGINATTGSSNIYIGNAGVAAEASTIRIGTSAIQTSTFIAGISGVTTGGVAVPVLIDGNGSSAPCRRPGGSRRTCAT